MPGYGGSLLHLFLHPLRERYVLSRWLRAIRSRAGSYNYLSPRLSDGALFFAFYHVRR